MSYMELTGSNGRAGLRLTRTDEHFEAFTIALESKPRSLVFAASTLLLSCFILDQRLWPEYAAEIVAKALLPWTASRQAPRRLEIWQLQDEVMHGKFKIMLDYKVVATRISRVLRSTEILKIKLSFNALPFFLSHLFLQAQG